MLARYVKEMLETTVQDDISTKTKDFKLQTLLISTAIGFNNAASEFLLQVLQYYGPSFLVRTKIIFSFMV